MSGALTTELFWYIPLTICRIGSTTIKVMSLSKIVPCRLYTHLLGHFKSECLTHVKKEDFSVKIELSFGGKNNRNCLTYIFPKL